MDFTRSDCVLKSCNWQCSIDCLKYLKWSSSLSVKCQVWKRIEFEDRWMECWVYIGQRSARYKGPPALLTNHDRNLDHDRRLSCSGYRSFLGWKCPGFIHVHVYVNRRLNFKKFSLNLYLISCHILFYILW